jgi:hypothetical protein
MGGHGLVEESQMSRTSSLVDEHAPMNAAFQKEPFTAAFT